MPKAKYFFNPESLTYHKVELRFIDKLKYLSKQFFVAIILAIVLFLISSYLIESPESQAIKRENQQLIAQYELLSKRFDYVANALKDMEQRDDNMYRAIFGAEPIPGSMRQAGFGGVDRYSKLESYGHAKLVIETTKKLDKLSKQMIVQSKSFDEIEHLIKNKEQMLSSIPAIIPISSKKLSKIPYGYGPRIDPVYKTPAFHEGMDFIAVEGVPVYATGNGTIIQADHASTGFGNHVRIDHGYGYKTIYAHLSKMKVRPGQKVKRGDLIGLVGNTGKSVGPHLHYEVHINNRPVNPINFYFSDLSPVEYDKIVTMAAQNGQSLD
jgi:murein DD-endopeptidase MepM/ murein hydrolase activator NlpD